MQKSCTSMITKNLSILFIKVSRVITIVQYMNKLNLEKESSCSLVSPTREEFYKYFNNGPGDRFCCKLSLQLLFFLFMVMCFFRRFLELFLLSSLLSFSTFFTKGNIFHTTYTYCKQLKI